MKVRQGFVSNSSSSSFCLVGFNKYNNEKIFNTLWVKDGFPEDEPDYDTDGYEEFEKRQIDNGVYQGDNLVFAGGPCLDACYVVGLDASTILENMSVKEARKHIKKLLKDKFDVTVDSADINLIVGESSSEY